MGPSPNLLANQCSVGFRDRESSLGSQFRAYSISRRLSRSSTSLVLDRMVHASTFLHPLFSCFFGNLGLRRSISVTPQMYHNLFCVVIFSHISEYLGSSRYRIHGCTPRLPTKSGNEYSFLFTYSPSLPLFSGNNIEVSAS